MKPQILNVLLVLAWASQIHGQQEPIVATPSELPNVFTAQTAYGELILQVPSPIIYKPKTSSPMIGDFVRVSLSKDGVPVRNVDSFFDTQPKPVKATIDESDDYEKKSTNSATFLTFKKTGKINITVSLGDQKINVPIEVTEIPYYKGMKSEELIQTLGLPQSNKKYFVKWPENKHVEGVFYMVSAGEEIYSVEHWKYDKLPHCIFSIRQGAIYGIHSICPDPTDKIRFPEAYKEAISAKYLGPKPDAPVAKNDQNQDDKEYRQWTDKSGNKINARFVKFFDSKVTLETKDGKTVDVRITQLIDEDAKIARKLNAELKKQKTNQK